MNDYVDPLTIDYVARGNSDDISQRLVSLWAQGQLTVENLAPICDRLVVLGGTGAAQDTPPIMFVGPASYATMVMGSQWRSEPHLANDRLDAEYRRLISASYSQIPLTGAPTFDKIATSLHDVCGRSVQVSYDRLLLPLFQPNGTIQILCYSHSRDTQRPVWQSDPAQRMPMFRQNTVPTNRHRGAA